MTKKLPPLRRLRSGNVTRKPIVKRKKPAAITQKRALEDAPRYTNIFDLLPGEPYFLLKGRDPLGEMFNMAWCLFRRYQIQMGLIPDTTEERAQLAAGFANSTEMQIFARDYAIKREHALTKFDKDGNAIARDGVHIPRGRKGS